MFEDDEEYWGDNRTYTRRMMRKHLAPPDVHVPNKNEGHLLRRLMSETGMNEEQIRSIQKYRQMLASASKVQGSSAADRFLKKMLKKITQQLKLAKEHPKVIDELKIQLQKLRSNRVPWYSRNSTRNAIRMIQNMTDQDVLITLDIFKK